MLETYILYNKETGEINSYGSVNREYDASNRDGSTVTEDIERRLLKFTDLDVLYHPERVALDMDKKTVVDGVLVAKSQVTVDAEQAVEQLEAEQEEKILAKTRELAITELKASGDLPADYTDKESR